MVNHTSGKTQNFQGEQFVSLLVRFQSMHTGLQSLWWDTMIKAKVAQYYSLRTGKRST